MNPAQDFGRRVFPLERRRPPLIERLFLVEGRLSLLEGEGIRETVDMKLIILVVHSWRKKIKSRLLGEC